MSDNLPPGAPRVEQAAPEAPPNPAGDAPAAIRTLQKQAAKVNTHLRFGKLDKALTEAYSVRLELESIGVEHPAVDAELALVEQVIARLERRRFGWHRYLARLFMKALFDALTGRSGQRLRSPGSKKAP